MKKILSVGTIMILCASLLCGCGIKVNDLATYAEAITDITIPEEARIIALGEAAHGNVEFQQLKLDVFKHLVETTDVRSFALEADFGGCAVANNYIVYNEGSAEEAVEALGFQIYATDQMLELIEWMHDYNLQSDENDKVRFYGFDMQRVEYSWEIVKEFYEAINTNVATGFLTMLEEIYGGEDSYREEILPEAEKLMNSIISDMNSNADTYIVTTGEETYAYALQAVNCLLQNAILSDETSQYSQIRDKYMAENTKWILNREENLYGTKLMISGHNGHVAKGVSAPYTNMGIYLDEEFGEEYFVIGTDFYNTTCNIANETGRGDYDFCSDDPLAKAVGELDENICYLDFVKANESEELAGIINNKMKMGSLGEGYSPLMKILKQTYQIDIVPSELYDGMILVYEATPIEVWEK